MTKAIFWDNDGVLVDTERHYFETTREALAGVGVELTDDDYLELFLRQAAGPWPLVSSAGFADEVIEELRKTRDALYLARLTDQPLVRPGVKETLGDLHGRYRMGIVSSAYQEHFDLAHRRTGLLPLFEFAITGADVAHVKPHPEPYLAAIARCGIRPDECLAVEDSPRGLASALAAGVPCIVVPTPLSARADFAGAVAILSDVRLLPEFIH